jgi:hypothetical protein
VTEGTCRRCGQAVRWVKTAKGKNMPLNPAPVTDDSRGAFTLAGGVALYVRPDERGTHAEVWESHFATCPARQPEKPSRKRFGEGSFWDGWKAGYQAAGMEAAFEIAGALNGIAERIARTGDGAPVHNFQELVEKLLAARDVPWSSSTGEAS